MDGLEKSTFTAWMAARTLLSTGCIVVGDSADWTCFRIHFVITGSFSMLKTTDNTAARAADLSNEIEEDLNEFW